MFDVAILGGGPGGTAGAVYAARKLLKTILITDAFGGQSLVSPEVQNWIGTEKISGDELAKRFEAHVKAYAGSVVEIAKGDLVLKVEKSPTGFVITTSKGQTFEASAVLIATGGTRRKLDVPGAKEFDQRGLTYCASCDGPLFSDQDVVVVGSGNAGFETAAQLLAYTKSVTLLQRGEETAADPVTVSKVLADPKMKLIKNAEIEKVLGDKFVTGIIYKDKTTGKSETVNVTGIFVEIGTIPSTQFVEGLVELDKIKRIIVDGKTQKTSVEGIWAAGDCTDTRYHQNNIAAGEGVKAIEDIYMALRAR